MLSAASKIATAAHLALLATAPFLLCPVLGADRATVAILWLVPFAVLWMFLAPAVGGGVPLHEARMRVARAVVRDPLVWLLLLLALYIGVRTLNGGVSAVYDLETGRWLFASPHIGWLPGSAVGTDFLPFASAVALCVVLPGVRHALGPDARMVFLHVSSALTGLAGGWMAYAAASGNAALRDAASCSYAAAAFVGTAFGFQLLAGIAAHFCILERKWLRAEPLSVVALAGNALGLAVFAPVFDIAVFLAAVIVLILSALWTERRHLGDFDSLRCVLAVLLALSVPVLYAMASGGGAVSEKFAAATALKPFPDGFVAARDALSGVAARAWREHPLFGTGLGSFALDLRFFGTPADWAVIPPGQTTPLNGWWAFLVERGVVGAILAAGAFGWLMWSYVTGLLTKPRAECRIGHLLGPVAVLVFVTVSFVSCPFSRVETVLSVTSSMALGVGAWSACGRRVS